MATGEGIRKRAGGAGHAASARDIPDKLYFRIGEVARLCDVPAYVLRFWETEFPQLRPNKGGTGQRLFRRRDVEMALRIKTLLYDEGYTIAGARQAFKAEARTGGKEPGLTVVPGPAAVSGMGGASGAGGATTDALGLTQTGPAQSGFAQLGSTQNGFAQPGLTQTAPDPRALQALRKELRDLHALLSRPPGAKSAGAAIHPIRPARPTPVPPPPSLPEPTPFARPRLLKPVSRRPDDLFSALFDRDEPGA